MNRDPGGGVDGQRRGCRRLGQIGARAAYLRNRSRQGPPPEAPSRRGRRDAWSRHRPCRALARPAGPGANSGVSARGKRSGPQTSRPATKPTCFHPAKCSVGSPNHNLPTLTFAQHARGGRVRLASRGQGRGGEQMSANTNRARRGARSGACAVPSAHCVSRTLRGASREHMCSVPSCLRASARRYDGVESVPLRPSRHQKLKPLSRSFGKS